MPEHLIDAMKYALNKKYLYGFDFKLFEIDELEDGEKNTQEKQNGTQTDK